MSNIVHTLKINMNDFARKASVRPECRIRYSDYEANKAIGVQYRVREGYWIAAIQSNHPDYIRVYRCQPAYIHPDFDLPRYKV